MKKDRITTAITVAALAVGAVAYVLQWRKNYQANQQQDRMPEDIAGPVELTGEEWDAILELDERTCMEACCVDYDEIQAYYDAE